MTRTSVSLSAFEVLSMVEIPVRNPVEVLTVTPLPAPPDQRPLLSPLPPGHRGWSSLNPAFRQTCTKRTAAN